MAAEFLTEELLSTSLMRLSREIEKTHPEFSETLARNTLRTCGLIPDLKRSEYYQELGILLIDLGRLYLAESDMLRPTSSTPVDDHRPQSS